jgi:hypothetical protein
MTQIERALHVAKASSAGAGTEGRPAPPMAAWT